MMKKILAVAVASALVAPAALAEVTVYGSLRSGLSGTHVSRGHSSASAGGRDASIRKQFRLVDESSRIGFKGVNKLDNGLSIVWGVETKFNLGYANPTDYVERKNAGSTFANGDVYLGIDSPHAGKLLAARRVDDPYSNFGDDVIGGLHANLNSSTTFTNEYGFVNRFGDKINNGLVYHSPSMYGLRAKLGWSNGTSPVTGQYNDEFNTSAYTGSLTYEHKYFQVGIAGRYVKDTFVDLVSGLSSVDVGGDNDKGLRTSADGRSHAFGGIVGLSVMPMEGLKLSTAYERIKSTSALVDNRQDGMGVGARYDMGNWVFHTSYAKLFNSKGTHRPAGLSSDGGWGVNFATAYKLSKQTSVVGGVAYQSADRAHGLFSTGTGQPGSFDGSRVEIRGNQRQVVPTPTGTPADKVFGANRTTLSLSLRTDF